MRGGGDPQLHETGPAADLFEYTTSSSDIQLTELEGGCRLIQIVSGASASALAVKTIKSGASWRILTVSSGDRLEPCQYIAIGSTGNGSANGVKVRCYR
jgi:hypothetical protein